MKKLKHNESNQQGFTLIEVMIALVLFSLILLLLFSNLFTAKQYWMASETSIEKNDEKRLVNQFLRRHLSQAVPMVWNDNRKRKLLFNGKTERLEFVSGLPSHRGGGGLYALTLYVEEENESSSLDLSYAMLVPDHPPFSDDAETQSVSLVENIEKLTISYFGSQKTNETRQWHDKWDNGMVMPELVRIQIKQANSVGGWPQIDIPINPESYHSLPEFLLQKSVALR